MKYLRVMLCMAVSLCIILNYNLYIICAEEKQEDLKLYARSATLIDAVSGRILYSYNGDEARANASTTKILTCILALEYGNLQSEVSISDNAVSQPKVRLGLNKKDKYYLNDLLYSLMLESHNDSAVAIAEHIAGTSEKFADMMNQKARDIGCLNSYFITPNGLDAKIKDSEGNIRRHETTAKDLCRIMMYCVNLSPQKEKFIEITQTRTYTFSDVEGRNHHSCNNHNSLLNMMDGVISGKTGFTGEAGYSYVCAVKRNGKCYIAAVLGCGWPPHKTYKWSDIKKLIEYGDDNYEYHNLSEIEIDAKRYKNIIVKNAKGIDTNMEVYIDLKLQRSIEDMDKILLCKDDRLEISYDIPRVLTAPKHRGTIVGYITYKLNGEKIKQFMLVVNDNIEKADLAWCYKQIMQCFSLEY